VFAVNSIFFQPILSSIATSPVRVTLNQGKKQKEKICAKTSNSSPPRDPPLSAGWRWVSEWKVEITEHTDASGYTYGFNFGPDMKAKMGSNDFVRRRKVWVELVFLLSFLF
jgi:hypothetical protein